MNGLLNQKQGRKATEQEQGAYKNIVMQVIRLLSAPESAAELEDATQKMGPAKALAMMVTTALQGVGQAAQSAGVKVASHTGMAAIREILMVLANVMQAGGLTEDGKATADEAFQLITQAMQGQQPQQAQPPMGAEQPMGA